MPRDEVSPCVTRTLPCPWEPLICQRFWVREWFGDAHSEMQWEEPRSPLVLPWLWGGQQEQLFCATTVPKTPRGSQGPCPPRDRQTAHCPSPRWERRAWRREGSSCGNVSLSRMRKPLLLSVLPCVLSVTRRGSAGTELLCHLPGAPVSAPGRNKPKER